MRPEAVGALFRSSAILEVVTGLAAAVAQRASVADTPRMVVQAYIALLRAAGFVEESG